MAALRRGADSMEISLIDRHRPVVPATSSPNIVRHGEAPARAEPLTPDLLCARPSASASPTSRSPPWPTGCRSRCGSCGKQLEHPPGLQDGGHLRRRVRGRHALLLLAPTRTENEAAAAGGDKALVIGCGPIRIGQGIEFDYCSVHAVWALQEAGYKAIIVNYNPRPSPPTSTPPTASTSSRWTRRASATSWTTRAGCEDRREHPVHRPVRRADGHQPGRAPWRAPALPILGSSAETIDLAEDRAALRGLPRQSWASPSRRAPACTTLEDALAHRQASSATRCWCAPATCWAAGRWRSSRTRTELIRYVTEPPN